MPEVNENYWDCECPVVNDEFNYIHSKDELDCKVCGIRQDYEGFAPPAHAIEVEYMLASKKVSDLPKVVNTYGGEIMSVNKNRLEKFLNTMLNASSSMYTNSGEYNCYEHAKMLEAILLSDITADTKVQLLHFYRHDVIRAHITLAIKEWVPLPEGDISTCNLFKWLCESPKYLVFSSGSIAQPGFMYNDFIPSNALPSYVAPETYTMLTTMKSIKDFNSKWFNMNDNYCRFGTYTSHVVTENGNTINITILTSKGCVFWLRFEKEF